MSATLTRSVETVSNRRAADQPKDEGGDDQSRDPLNAMTIAPRTASPAALIAIKRQASIHPHRRRPKQPRLAIAITDPSSRNPTPEAGAAPSSARYSSCFHDQMAVSPESGSSSDSPAKTHMRAAKAKKAPSSGGAAEA